MKSKKVNKIPIIIGFLILCVAAYLFIPDDNKTDKGTDYESNNLIEILLDKDNTTFPTLTASHLDEMKIPFKYNLDELPSRQFKVEVSDNKIISATVTDNRDGTGTINLKSPYVDKQTGEVELRITESRKKIASKTVSITIVDQLAVPPDSATFDEVQGTTVELGEEITIRFLYDPWFVCPREDKMSIALTNDGVVTAEGRRKPSGYSYYYEVTIKGLAIGETDLTIKYDGEELTEPVTIKAVETSTESIANRINQTAKKYIHSKLKNPYLSNYYYSDENLPKPLHRGSTIHITEVNDLDNEQYEFRGYTKTFTTTNTRVTCNFVITLQFDSTHQNYTVVSEKYDLPEVIRDSID